MQTRLTEMLGIEHPVMLAGMGGVSYHAVVAAVDRIAEAPGPGTRTLVGRSLNGGFADGPDGLVLVTDRELFGTVRVRRPKALRRVVPRALRSWPGDQ